MSEAKAGQERDWDSSFDGAERFALEAALRATPAERLAWLEQAIEFAYRAGAVPRRDEPGEPTTPSR